MLEGYHFQNAYVTRNLDKWVDVFQERGKVDRVISFETSTMVKTPTGTGAQHTKLAFIWIGDLQYELIQSLGGSDSIFRDALPDDDSLRFHHICMRVPTWDDIRARIDQQSYPVVLEGGADGVRFVYLDARPFLGHYVEYSWMSDDLWRQVGGLPVQL